jgi:hypothetical protein
VTLRKCNKQQQSENLEGCGERDVMSDAFGVSTPTQLAPANGLNE